MYMMRDVHFADDINDKDLLHAVINNSVSQHPKSPLYFVIHLKNDKIIRVSLVVNLINHEIVLKARRYLLLISHPETLFTFT